ncbi:hypothetical protein TIFTF001_042464 [Ficus carica]|uniref:Uncharacterized protein n=1 Tax=Ficus carica TaxID=3494 RepID=A0AA88DFE1_FICCA|nr:hypothetical protein TIFTF001_042464 [Ficus carica]
MFMKSWARICRSEKPVLPPDLTPFFDMSVIRDPNGLDLFYVKHWLAHIGTTSKDDDLNLFQFPKMADFGYRLKPAIS